MEKKERDDVEDTLLNFVKSQSIEGFKATGNVYEMIELNYDLFNESTLHELIRQALIERDKKVLEGKSETELLGTWGILIDIFKDITSKKKENTEQIIALLYDIGCRGGRQEIANKLQDLKRGKQIDVFFVESIKRIRDMLITATETTEQSVILSLIVEASLNEISSDQAREMVVSRDEKNHQNISASNNISSQRELEAAGELLQELLARCPGDATKLRAELVSNMRSHTDITCHMLFFLGLLVAKAGVCVMFV
jgi:hypothetical protein